MLAVLAADLDAIVEHPELVRWVLGDIDRLALACAGVQVAAHGMPVVTLRPGNALAA